jgi:uncharacterized alpha-E superfamily protein
MLSGVADSIYWLNRYIEKSENIAHFAEVNFNLILDSPSGITQLFTDLPKLSPLCENVKRTLKPKVRKGLLNALSHISDAKYQNILFVKLVPDWLNN